MGFEKFCDRISKVLFIVMLAFATAVTLVQIEKANKKVEVIHGIR